MASHSARREAYSEPTGVRGTPQWTTRTATPDGSATGETALVRQSTSNAWPARPKSDASWSMRPPGTPVAAVSAADARCATSIRLNSVRAQSASARTNETDSAELDESPDPAGIVDATVSSVDGTATPRAVRAATAAA